MSEKLFPVASATVGPFFPTHFFGPGDHDLTFSADPAKRARGQKIYLCGKVYEAKRVPRWNTILEIWQADAGGHFAHPNDPEFELADRNFMGWGRRATDSEGGYEFVSVMPGTYLDPLTGKTRAPHIDLTVLGSGLMRRLTTTLFFAGQPGNDADPVLSVIPDPRIRERLLLKPAQIERAPADALAYRLDIVLQGEDETPFFAD